jgi:hypothetical protein
MWRLKSRRGDGRCENQKKGGKSIKNDIFLNDEKITKGGEK